MTTKKVVLRFPPELSDQPVTYNLIKEYDLMVNILRGHITPKEEGMLVLELTGKKTQLDRGMEYLTQLGVETEKLSKDIRWLKDRCTHCTACTSLCPSEALSVDRDTMIMSFERSKCIACEMCVTVCPYNAMEVSF
ncbi:MAG: 4Fe-4S dicluster domain-containing protein [Proteobacteria bacterium]|nr:4Fe-4S dicluster domain-containing protein [Pseudomonadota bacterium]